MFIELTIIAVISTLVIITGVAIAARSEVRQLLKLVEAYKLEIQQLAIEEETDIPVLTDAVRKDDEVVYMYSESAGLSCSTVGNEYFVINGCWDGVRDGDTFHIVETGETRTITDWTDITREQAKEADSAGVMDDMISNFNDSDFDYSDFDDDIPF